MAMLETKAAVAPKMASVVKTMPETEQQRQRNHAQRKNIEGSDGEKSRQAGKKWQQIFFPGQQFHD